MPQIRILLEAHSPLLLGEGPAISNVQTSARSVSGSIWRGTLAGAVLRALGLRGTSPELARREPDFATLFAPAGGESPARFGTLYPARQRWNDLANSTVLPLPLSTRSCKSHRGFVEDIKVPGHGMYDGTLNRLREAAQAQRPYQRGLELCPQCNTQRLERARGVALRVSAGAGERGYYSAVKTGTRSFVRVGLNRHTETAQDQILYVLDTLVSGSGAAGDEAPLTFVGTWYGSTAQEQAFRRILARYFIPTDDGGYRMRIGGARARGMGQVVLHLETSANNDAAANDAANVPDHRRTLAERLDALQPRENGQLLDQQHLYATLSLHSPLVLLDTWGLAISSAGHITRQVLQAYVEPVPEDLAILADYSIVEPHAWCGWSTAWGLPKPAVRALAAGSVLLLRAPAGRRESLLNMLAQIEQEGLGERRAEGWGEILVCDRFHNDHDEESADGNQ